MIKTIIKETGIIILLLIAIALILGIVFYEYIPTNKTVPVKIKEYALSEDVQNELKESIAEEQNVVKTFYIGNDDLDLYEAKKDYDKGKANPFADYTQQEKTTNTNTTNNENVEKNKIASENNQQSNTQQNEVYINTPGKNY